jgi:hypothetical protein
MFHNTTRSISDWIGQVTQDWVKQKNIIMSELNLTKESKKRTSYPSENQVWTALKKRERY